MPPESQTQPAPAMPAPANFEDPTQTDVTMDGRTPIDPNPPAGPAPAPDTNFDQRVAAEVTRRMENFAADHAAALAKATDDAEKATVLMSLKGFIDGNTGEDVGALQFKGAVQDLIMEIHGGTERPLAEIMKQAGELQEARLQKLRDDGGDGSQDMPEMRRPNDDTDGRFDMGMFMGTLGSEIIRLGDEFDGEKMTGAPEMEFASEIVANSEWAKKKFRQLQKDAGKNSRVVPVPAAALAPSLFAETYGTDVATRRQPTFRRDALVPYFRPANVLRDIGVPMPMISNDITVPRLSGSLTAGYLAENAQIPEGNLTVANQTTSPKRMGAYDPISWMLLAAGDAQFGHVPLVVNEMMKAVAQGKESAVYGGVVANGPTGIRGTSGILSKDLGATDPTYADMLNMITRIANLNIPVSQLYFVVNQTIRELLSTTQRFAGGASILNDVAFRETGSGPANIGSYGASVMGTIAGHPTAVTNHIPVVSSGTDSGDTYMYAGVWEFVWCPDYSVIFLTVDDISAARTGQTFITVNAYNDIVVRLATAFNVVTHDTTP